MSSEIENQIREYIRKYANKHHVSFEEAKEHAICKLIEEYYSN